MTDDDDAPDRLAELWRRGVCPSCGNAIREGTRVGSGRRSDGGFCSLGCYASFHGASLAARHALVERLITIGDGHSK